MKNLLIGSSSHERIFKMGQQQCSVIQAYTASMLFLF